MELDLLSTRTAWFEDMNKKSEPRRALVYFEKQDATDDSLEVEGTGLSISIYKVVYYGNQQGKNLIGRNIYGLLNGNIIDAMETEIKNKIKDENN